MDWATLWINYWCETTEFQQKVCGFHLLEKLIGSLGHFASWPRIVFIIKIIKWNKNNNCNKQYSINLETIIQKLSLVKSFRPSGKELHVHFKRSKCSLDMSVTTSCVCAEYEARISIPVASFSSGTQQKEMASLHMFHLAKCGGGWANIVHLLVSSGLTQTGYSVFINEV